MTGQQLKNSILQMAVQGKLVPQDSNDEPASVLLEKIRKEKEQLIKEGKIKKEKNPSLIFRGTDNLFYEKVGNKEPVCIADEVPFEIPDSWEWVRLGTILHKLSDGTHSTPKYVDNGVPFISVKDISSGFLDFSSCKYISMSEHADLYARCNPEYGDILLTKVGTTGIPVIVDTNEAFSLFVSVALLKFNQQLLCNEFLIHLINSPLVQKQATEHTRGVGNKNWVMRDIANTLIVIPPLKEQYRIVSEIQKYDRLLHYYSKMESELSNLNDRFPDVLKKSILQEAVQGKLVSQDENDEPAEVLLERIRAEKEALIKAGKIKRDKHESVIFRRDNSHYEKLDGIERCIDDEIPFDIPDNWMWVRLGFISTYAHSKQKINAQMADPNTWGLDLEDIEKGGKLLSKKTVGDRKAVGDKTLFHRGDILYSKLRPYLLKILVASDNGICTPEIVPFTMFGNIIAQYIVWYLSSPYVDNLINAITYGVKMPRVGTDAMTQLLVPIPPLAEQQRIVEKIKDILSYCEKL